jgi:hypothetical protein
MDHSSEKTTLRLYAQLPSDCAALARQTMERLLVPSDSPRIDTGLGAQAVPDEDAHAQGNRGLNGNHVDDRTYRHEK